MKQKTSKVRYYEATGSYNHNIIFAFYYNDICVLLLLEMIWLSIKKYSICSKDGYSETKGLLNM